jgi:hypothetical protein
MAAMLHPGTQLFGAGLAPIHRTATRNARRLARPAEPRSGFPVGSPTIKADHPLASTSDGRVIHRAADDPVDEWGTFAVRSRA